MEWIRWALIFILLTRVMVTDVKDGVIENKVIVISLVTFLGFTWIADGVEGLVRGTKMCGIIFCVLFLFYLIKGLGAGDVKLLSVMTLPLQERIWNVLFGALVLTAVYGLMKMLHRGMCHETIYKKGETVAFSVPIGIATVGVLLQEYIM